MVIEEKIRIEDLSVLQVGDWIQDENGFSMKVVAVGEDWCNCTFPGCGGDVWEFDRHNPAYGIPLTEEICERNGWKNGLIYPHHRLMGFKSGCVALVDEAHGEVQPTNPDIPQIPIILANVRTFDQLQRYLRTQGRQGRIIAETMKK